MFKIKVVNDKKGPLAIVTSNGYESPLSFLPEIEHELALLLSDNLNGEVLFDLVCSNGLEWNRFMCLRLKNGCFILDTAKVIDQQCISSEILRQQAEMLANDPLYFRNSILTPEEQVLIVKCDKPF